MNTHRLIRGPRVRAALGGTAAALLLTGATWSGLNADSAAPARPAVSAVAGPIEAGRDSYADVVKIAAPAVVTIRTEGSARVAPTAAPGDQNDLFRRFFGETPWNGRSMPRAPRRGLGSGVIVTSDGYVLTNHHVVDGADQIHVDLTDGRSELATLVGSDKPSDLALLKIDAANLQALTLGDSDAVQVGDVVLALGNPLGIGQTVTMGIVSAKGRETRVGDGAYEDFIQTDAPINHGNSGGALVNTRGQLIGINSQIISVSEGNIGIGFAIPANMARHVMDSLRTDGRVRRAKLGVSVQQVTPDMAASLGLAEPRGAIVSAVEKGSAAEEAGVQRGDVIRSFNGQAVHDTNSLRNRVATTDPGSKATLVVVRDGREHTLTVALDEVAEAAMARRGGSPDKDAASLGIAVAPLTPESARRGGLPTDMTGLVVQDVNPDGRAADAGLRAGDVIQEVNRRPVKNIDELRKAVQGAGDKPVLMLVNRDGRDLFLTVS